VIKYIIKQIRRSAVTNVFFCLLLALAGALLCISAGLWYSAHKALVDIDKTVTTIAVPDLFAIEQYALNYIERNNITEYETENGMITQAIGKEADFVNAVVAEITRDVLDRIREEVYPSGLFRMDDRRIFNAISDSAAPVPLRSTGLGLSPGIMACSPQSSAALIVTCLMFKDTCFVQSRPAQDGSNTRYLQHTAYAVFDTEEQLHIDPAYKQAKYINIFFNILNNDGSMPVEVGERYLVTGALQGAGGYPRSSTHLIVDVPKANVTGKVVDHAYDLYQANLLLNSAWNDLVHFGLDEFPMEVVEYSFERQPGAEDGRYTIFKLDGSLEDALASDYGEIIKDALESVNVSIRSFPVLTSNNANSLFAFNQHRNLLLAGRLFTAEEAEEGALVCLVSQQFAEFNGLEVGSTLPMSFYANRLGKAEVTYKTSDGGPIATHTFWTPSRYSPNLEISGPIEYKVIGIYNIVTANHGDYVISPNTVIIPDKSFSDVSGEPLSRFDVPRFIPLLADGMIVPNGQVGKTIGIIDGIADGYGAFLKFYDQGYDTLKAALANLRLGMAWILALSCVGWAAVAFLFSMFFVSRKRKEAAVLHAIGVKRGERFQWVFVQCAVVILLAAVLSFAASQPLYDKILEITGDAAEAFTVSFRNLTLSDAAETGIRNRIPIAPQPLALLFTTIGGAVLMFAISGFVSAKSVVFRSLDERRDG